MGEKKEKKKEKKDKEKKKEKATVRSAPDGSDNKCVIDKNRMLIASSLIKSVKIVCFKSTKLVCYAAISPNIPTIYHFPTTHNSQSRSPNL